MTHAWTNLLLLPGRIQRAVLAGLCVAALEGCVMSSGGPEVLVSRDGGRSWAERGPKAEFDYTLRAVWGTSPDEIYAVGITARGDGLIFHGSSGGRRWRSEDTEPPGGLQSSPLNAICGGPAGVFAAGDHGVLLQRAAGRWTARPSGTDAALYALQCTAGGELYAAGVGGLLAGAASGGPLHGVGPRANLRALWSDGAHGLYAGGAGEVILRSSDGVTWQQVHGGGPETVRALCAMPTGAILAAGSEGLLLRAANGARFEPADSGTRDALYGVADLGQGAVLAITGHGGMLRSADGGARFTAQAGAALGDYFSLYRLPGGELVAVGQRSVPREPLHLN